LSRAASARKAFPSKALLSKDPHEYILLIVSIAFVFVWNQFSPVKMLDGTSWEHWMATCVYLCSLALVQSSAYSE
jgi:hypothetical protein